LFSEQIYGQTKIQSWVSGYIHHLRNPRKYRKIYCKKVNQGMIIVNGTIKETTALVNRNKASLARAPIEIEVH
jgi:hypothetical protein